MKKVTAVGLLVVSGVAVIGYALYSYAKKQASLLENYTYKIVDFKIENFDLQKIKGSISVLFGSQADVEVVIQNFILDFYFNDKKVGYIEDTTEFVIPARGYTTIPFKYTLNPQLIFNNTVDIVSYALRQKDASISVRGYAKLKSGIVTATLPISYQTTIKQILSD
jgi:hypothetical protein